MNMAWDKFTPCPPLKELIPVVQNHPDTEKYYQNLKEKIYP